MQKQRLQTALDSFSDEVDVDEFLNRVILLEKIEQGEREIEAGQVVSQEEAKDRLEKWLA